ncbi:ribokinase [Raineyella fluvialis]|uniref:Ribokinase n=1 Tax=Raineyella fluvialis TaxID=2662261 RepID=A0A5Q2FC02_9ACTN|nr:ribokinase [Raineyella fluvialis]QGF23921.1 ribokinase [Raineyella fluvialis]
MTVAVVGSLNADLLLRVADLPRPGETVLGISSDTQPGGKGANQALAARLAGADVVMVGAIGDDAQGQVALRLLRDAGVDLSAVRVDELPTGLAVVTTDADGENSIVVVAGANGSMDADAVAEAAPAYATADLVVVQGELPVEAVAAVARAAAGRLVVNLAPAVPVAADVLRRADPLVVNEIEAAAALEILTGASAGEEAPQVLAERLHRAGVPSVVVTVGADGCIVVTSGGTTQVPSPHVHVVDTVGAGDAYVGALAARLDRGDDLVEAARFAVRFAAASVRHHGAQPSYPRSLDELPE